jgi:hypothetical protein
MTNVSDSVEVMSSCNCHDAAKWAALSYEIAGESSTIQPFMPEEDGENATACHGWLVVVPRAGRVECVIDGDFDLRDAVKRIDEISDSGWSVWALLPLARMTLAHEVFEAHVERIQGWWDRGDSITFTSPEIP